jgi:hypothetical protein
MPKSWEQKYRGAKPAHVAVLEKPYAGLRPGQRLFIADPPLLERRIRAIPSGAALGVPELRAALAREHGADATCPTSTAIFLRIVTEVALARIAAGDADPAPVWRVIAPGTPLAGKLGVEGEAVLRARRAAEGL